MRIRDGIDIGLASKTDNGGSVPLFRNGENTCIYSIGINKIRLTQNGVSIAV